MSQLYHPALDVVRCEAVAILGGGAFGHALAKVARRHIPKVTMWSRRDDARLPEGVTRAATLAEAAGSAPVLFFCVPAAHARAVLRELGDFVDGGHLLIHAARGLDPAGHTVSAIVREETPIRRVGVLAGPLVPAELEAAIPSAIVVASRYPEVRQAAQAALSQEALRVYGSDDLVGVELAAALMTVLALGAGLVTGLGGGVSTRALIVTRGLAQSARVLEAMGAKARTLVGLGGVGEVFVTAQGTESPDYQLGLALAGGSDVGAALASVGRSCEAPSVARSVAALAREKKVRAPLFGAVVEIVDGKRPPEEALREFFISAPTEIRLPELPDVTVYVESLRERVVGSALEKIRFASPFLLRSAVPPISDAYGKRVLDVRRLGKRIVFALEGDYFLVLHLMVAGRLKWAKKGAGVPGRIGLAAFDFAAASGGGTMLLTEASTKKRASLHLAQGTEALATFDRGGLEPMDAKVEQFAEALRRENHTLKRSLTDPRLFSGIGNAYSDEILHRAKLSPVALTSRLTDAQIATLHRATLDVLREWTERLRAEAKSGFPEKVTAFREDMAVHGKYGKPCPVCGSKVQRIKFADNEHNYCATCQTGGKLLADRSLSRLLKGDWPKTLEEMEERRAAGREQVAELGVNEEEGGD